MEKKNILFVDDEPNILSGLKRMLRSIRKEANLHFANNGKDALALLTVQPVDVIVSDMRMPGMDGATLLTIVKEKYPHIIRIMLTGQADEASLLRTVDVVHQCMAKPSETETLKEVIARVCALQDMLNDHPLKSLISRLGNLPSLPSVYNELRQKLKDPECGIDDIGKVIEKDISMSAKVLQLVNSAFFGLYTNIDSPGRAVHLLGLDTVNALVLGLGVFSELNPAASKEFCVSSLWNHSIVTAAYARKIAQLETDDKEVIDNSFIAGLIHDIGKLILFVGLEEQYIQAIESARENETTLRRAERTVFNADHSDVGGYLMGLWGLPGMVVEAAMFHHRLDEYPARSFTPALAVHAADVIFYMLQPEKCIGSPPEPDRIFLQAAGGEDRFDFWLKECGSIQLQGI